MVNNYISNPEHQSWLQALQVWWLWKYFLFTAGIFSQCLGLSLKYRKKKDYINTQNLVPH